MKTTARLLTGWIAVVTSFSAGVAIAGPLAATTESLVGPLCVSQLKRSNTGPEDKRRQADDLLGRARRALAEDDLQAAESLISQAEATGVQYGPLHLGSTPEKLRRELQQKRDPSPKWPKLPSQIFSPRLFQNKTTRSDPFAERSSASATLRAADAPKAANAAANPAPGADRTALQPLTPLPRLDALSPTPSQTADGPFVMALPFGRSPSSWKNLQTAGHAPAPGSFGTSLATDARDDDLLRQARRALAMGDVARATRLVENAKQRPRSYGPLDDAPERVETAIRQYREIMAQQEDTAAWRRRYVRMLMEQSEALLRSRDYDQAEQLAEAASRNQLTYRPFETNPKDLLRRIAAARRGGDPAAGPPRAETVAAEPPGTPTASLAARQKVVELCRQARQAISAGQFDLAESLARQAEQFRVPDSAFAPGEDRPGVVLLDIRVARRQDPAGVIPAGGQLISPATGPWPPGQTASRALYDPSHDPTRNVPAAHRQQFAGGLPTAASRLSDSPPFPRQFDLAQNGPSPLPLQHKAAPSPVAVDATADGQRLLEQGEAALKAHDTARAYQFFQQAAGHMNRFDPITRQRLQGYLQLLAAPNRTRPGDVPAESIVDQTAARQQLLIRQISLDLAQQEATARSIRETDPQGALNLLQDARNKVEAAGLEPQARQQLLRRVDRQLADTQQFIEQNRPRIALQESNQYTREEIQREQSLKLEIQEKLALMVDSFNKMMDEQRYAEAEVVAKRAAELDPDNPLIQQLLWESKFVRRFFSNEALKTRKEESLWSMLDSVDESGIPFDDRDPYRFPDAKTWEALVNARAKYLQRGRERTEQDLEIERKLKTPVSLQFNNATLQEVLDYLARVAQVNLHVDPQGLAEEGVTTNTTVTISLQQEIMLKSALNLILEPLHLSYVIKDEVLKITSEQLRDGEVYVVSYNVADLVVPIPNFVPTARLGLAGAYHDAMGNVGFGGSGPFGTTTTPLAVVASKDGAQNAAAINPTLLAQMSAPGTPSRGMNMPLGFGPGGLGGAAQADFDSLIELITTTIQPTTWDEVGGPGSIADFPTNLSLVVSQTQDVHEEIVDLLEQLRRMQDLQVTIEVRFITLNDNFFERIGVDFDFDIDDDIDRPFQVFGRQIPGQVGDPATGTEPPRNTLDVDHDRSVTVGMQSPGVFSADLDIPFTQNSFGLAVPQFGGFDASAGAQLGFAILSDIEAFFFISAAQGDRRSNVLQAPKVTLFNGQQAYVSDTSQSPFVISVIPVVGDFAAAQQPVIVVLSEGTFMTVQATVSNDRRFVRLTVVPFFSQIGEVKTFQFTGSTTSTTDVTADNGQLANPGAADDARRNNATSSEAATTTTNGTTVQLPTFSFVTVTTTVSVPDGGTVLLGGIKRLNEGRNEFGVPMLNKIPYINRLFKNVGIGRETQSLMMMVTPRIIIQEEEEEKIGVPPPP